MPKTLHAAIRLPLPDDVFGQAEVLARFKPHWDTFLSAVADPALKHEIDTDEMKSSTKPAVTGAKRGRKPKSAEPTVSTAPISEVDAAISQPTAE